MYTKTIRTLLTERSTLRLTLLSLFVAAGCIAGGDDGGTGGPGGTGGTEDEPQINGKPASKFYEQFTHVVSNGVLTGAAAFPEQTDGRNAFKADFFLMPNNKLVLFYAEGTGEVTLSGHSLALIGSSQKRLQGTWRIEGAELVLDAYLRCAGTTVNGRDALYCTLEKAIGTPVATGRGGTFDLYGPSSPDDSSWVDYQP